MSITIQVNNTGIEQNSLFAGANKAQNNQRSGQNIFAGNVNEQNDSIEAKKKQAQEKAFKLVCDAWEVDKKIDTSISERLEDIQGQKKIYDDAYTQKKTVIDNEKKLQEDYGVNDESQEQKDLILMEKYYEHIDGFTKEEFAYEEIKKAQELIKGEKTDYQKQALEIHSQQSYWKSQMRDAKKQMQDDIDDIKMIKLENLKNQGMLDANNEAEDILKASSKEILGMLLDEGKENVDEQIEENKEKEKELEKEQKQKEEQRENIEEKRAMEQAVVQGTKEAVERAENKKKQNDADNNIDFNNVISDAINASDSTGVSQGLDDIKNSMKLLEADLKGIKVDTEA